jgi:hypothetical protein
VVACACARAGRAEPARAQERADAPCAWIILPLRARCARRGVALLCALPFWLCSPNVDKKKKPAAAFCSLSLSLWRSAGVCLRPMELMVVQRCWCSRSFAFERERGGGGWGERSVLSEREGWLCHHQQHEFQPLLSPPPQTG